MTRRPLLALSLMTALLALGQPALAQKVRLSTSQGDIVLQLDAAKAPKTVDNFVQYVKSGHYAGTIFHRVIDGFMVQGGGMTESMDEKPTRAPIPLEAGNGLSNVRGAVAMEVETAEGAVEIVVERSGEMEHQVADRVRALVRPPPELLVGQRLDRGPHLRGKHARDADAEGIETMRTLHDAKGWRGGMLGILPTFFDGTRESKSSMEDLQSEFGDKVLQPIHKATVLRECWSEGKTIFEHAPESRSAEEYTALAKAVLNY